VVDGVTYLKGLSYVNPAAGVTTALVQQVRDRAALNHGRYLVVERQACC